MVVKKVTKGPVKPGPKPGAKAAKAPATDPLADFDLSVGAQVAEAAAESEAPEAAEEPTEATEELDTTITLEGIKSSIAQAGMAGQFLFFRDGDKKEVRFLDDLREGVRVPRHEQFDRGLKPTTCLRVYGQDCPFCNEQIPARDWYAWNVIDFSSGAVKVVTFKAFPGSIVAQLGEHYAANGSIKKTNFVISQVGSAMQKKLTLTARERKSPDDIAKIRKAIQVFTPKKFDLKDALRPAEAGGGAEGGGINLDVEGESDAL